MMYKVEYSKAADRTLRKWKESSPTLFKKATKVLIITGSHADLFGMLPSPTQKSIIFFWAGEKDFAGPIYFCIFAAGIKREKTCAHTTSPWMRRR